MGMLETSPRDDLAEFASHYATVCDDQENVPHLLSQYEGDFVEIQNLLNSHLDQFETEVNVTELSHKCGDDLKPYIDGAHLLLANVGILQNIIADQIPAVARCDRTANIYNAIVLEGVCTKMSFGIGLTSILLLCISLFGMVLITLRVSYYLPKLSLEDRNTLNKKKELEEYRRYIGRHSYEWETYPGAEISFKSHHTQPTTHDNQLFEEQEDTGSYLHDDCAYSMNDSCYEGSGNDDSIGDACRRKKPGDMHQYKYESTETEDYRSTDNMITPESFNRRMADLTPVAVPVVSEDDELSHGNGVKFHQVSWPSETNETSSSYDNESSRHYICPV